VDPFACAAPGKHDADVFHLHAFHGFPLDIT
jgi:hypothetical protein